MSSVGELTPVLVLQWLGEMADVTEAAVVSLGSSNGTQAIII